MPYRARRHRLVFEARLFAQKSTDGQTALILNARSGIGKHGSTKKPLKMRPHAVLRNVYAGSRESRSTTFETERKVIMLT